MEHFTSERATERLTRGRFRVVRTKLSFDGVKRFLIAPIARRWPKLYEKHLAFLFPARTLHWELEPL